VQTFITSSSATFGVENLDNKRLNKQLLECRQIMNILLTLRNDPETKPGWRNHPAVRMWAGNEYGLLHYVVQVAHELNKRGIKYETNYDAIVYDSRLMNLLATLPYPSELTGRVGWLADPVALDKIITTHRASLYHKDPEYYAKWKIDGDWVDNHHDDMVCCSRCNYYWPSHVEA
jgi:hypothetical protein